MEKRTAEDWDTARLERLSVEYMAVRREMWNVLATRLGEKWQNVEAKVSTKLIEHRLRGLRNDLVHGEGHQKYSNSLQGIHTPRARRYGYALPTSTPSLSFSTGGQRL
jgi:hypothetical protein